MRSISSAPERTCSGWPSCARSSSEVERITCSGFLISCANMEVSCPMEVRRPSFLAAFLKACGSLRADHSSGETGER